MIYGRDDYDDPIKLAGIPLEEPVLLIRSQDEFALKMIDHLLQLLRARNDVDDSTTCSLARHRERMFAWRQQHGTKIPDVPNGDHP